MTPLEDRLQTELRAESQQIQPDSLPSLRLPAPAAGRLGQLRHRGVQHWGPRHGGRRHWSASYYAYPIQGTSNRWTVHGVPNSDTVGARYIDIRATVSSKLLDTISPPAPYNSFLSMAGAANDRVFVFAAQWNRSGKNGVPLPYSIDQREPLKFEVLRISPGGQMRLSSLSLPQTLTTGQEPTISVSPDGTKLAIAFGGSGTGRPATVQVVTLATGQLREWQAPSSAAAPILAGLGSWTANGRVLEFGQWFVAKGGDIQRTVGQVRLLDTTAPGGSLAAARLVELPQDVNWPTWPMISPDGSALIGTTGGARTPGLGNAVGPGAFGLYSARTGKLLHVLARWGQSEARLMIPPPAARIAWSNFTGSKIIVEMPRGTHTTVGYAGNGNFTPLPNAAVAPLLSAVATINTSADGGNIGLAW
jgi:hypothetical protein